MDPMPTVDPIPMMDPIPMVDPLLYPRGSSFSKVRR